MVLKSLRDDAAKALSTEVTDAVITVPAYFNDLQRTATRQAAELAGLNVRRILNEPTAAALAYGFHDREASKRLLVIDLGGGTFDVTLMEIFEGTLEIIASAGESQLGGEDFTERLVGQVLQLIGQQLERAEMEIPLTVARLRSECEIAKRTLAEQTEAVVRIPDEQGNIGDSPKKVRIDRATYKKAVSKLIDRINGPIDRVLRDGSTPPDAIEDVILVGGATRMPVLRDLVEERFGRPGMMKFDPDQVVALGAAVQAALIADDRAVDDMVMTDVCPFTLGVDSARTVGHEMRAGYYTPVIDRNTTIPVSREMPFETVRPNQSVAQCDVYQGEHRRVANNTKLGELRVEDIPLGPAGQVVYVRFTYDLNGILEVEAYAEGAEHQKRSVVLTQHAATLSGEELAAAVKRLADLKFYPREDQPTQKLLRTAERLVGEVGPHQRQSLEAAIDAFEEAIAMSDKQAVEAARDSLQVVLSSLGFET